MADKGEAGGRITPGFMSPVESQRTFRAVLDAMSRPGRIVPAGENLSPPAPIRAAFGAVCLTLLDFETPIWIDPRDESAVLEWIRFHCGAPLAASSHEAAFALITHPGALCPLNRFHPGEEERPERSATVLVQVAGLGNESGLTLIGPGIEDTARLSVDGLPSSFRVERIAMEALFPLGLDIIFAADRTMAALPRTTRIEG